MTILDEPTMAEPVAAAKVAGRVLPVLVAIAASLMIAAALLGLLARQGGQVDGARREALKRAQTRLPRLLSYQHDHLGRDLDRAAAQTTGSFGEDYRKLLTSTVRPTAERRKVDTRAAVSGAGVVEAKDSRVVVLAFLTQSTVTGSGPAVLTGSRVEATMVRVGDDWLVGDLKPV